MLGEKLCKIGFTRSEAVTYIEMLRIGAQPVSILAKRVGMNRTTIYSVLRSLLRKGVVSSCDYNGTKFFSANDPNCLVGFVDRKMRTFDYYRSEMLGVVPQFRTLMNEYDFKRPVVSYFDGMEGVRQIMRDVFTAEKELCTFLSLHKLIGYGLDHFLDDLKNFRRNNSKLILRAIVPAKPDIKAFFVKNFRKNDKKLLVNYVDDEALFLNQINLYNDKVLIVNLERGVEHAVLIENKHIFGMQKKIFDLVWKGCKVNS